MEKTILETPIKIICKEICSPRPWKYEASMIIFGKKRFLTFGDTIGDVKKTALRRVRALLLKTSVPD